MPRKPISLTNRRFGSLTVLRMLSRNKHGNSRWLCKCDCGNEHEVMYQNLKLGSVKTCGCGIVANAPAMPTASDGRPLK